MSAVPVPVPMLLSVCARVCALSVYSPLRVCRCMHAVPFSLTQLTHCCPSPSPLHACPWPPCSSPHSLYLPSPSQMGPLTCCIRVQWAGLRERQRPSAAHERGQQQHGAQDRHVSLSSEWSTCRASHDPCVKRHGGGRYDSVRDHSGDQDNSATIPYAGLLCGQCTLPACEDVHGVLPNESTKQYLPSWW